MPLLTLFIIDKSEGQQIEEHTKRKMFQTKNEMSNEQNSQWVSSSTEKKYDSAVNIFGSFELDINK